MSLNNMPSASTPVTNSAVLSTPHGEQSSINTTLPSTVELSATALHDGFEHHAEILHGNMVR